MNENVTWSGNVQSLSVAELLNLYQLSSAELELIRSFAALASQHVDALIDVQGASDFAAGVLPGVAQYLAGMPMSATRDLVRNVVNLEHVRSGAKVRDKRSSAGDTLDVALVGEFP